MNEYLFKLKKDGETVGYLKIDRGLVCWRHTTLSAAINKTWHTVHNSVRIDFDTAHPFVTKDKNGKDVFANDKVQSKDGLRRYKVAWDERRCRWWLCGIDKPWAVNEPIWEDYTLIEDKEND